MLSLIRSRSSTVWSSGSRTFLSKISSSSFSTADGPRLKAVENWKRPTMDELLVPHEKWEQYDARHQKKYNLYLIGGVAFFGFTLAVAKASGLFFFNTTPPYAKETGFSTKNDGGNLTRKDAKKEQPKKEPKNEVAQTSAAAVSPIPVTSMRKEVTPGVPKHIPYLLIGSGTASFAAYRAIRAKDPTAKILIVGDEKHLPYMRPPLSKELWFSERAPPEFENDLRFTQWNGRNRSLFFEPSGFYMNYKELDASEKGGISVLSGRKVVRIDATSQEAFLDNGDVIRYDKCLLATGGKPKMLPVLERNSSLKSKISVFRTIDDFLRLEELGKHFKKVAVIGGGFLGSELACALGAKAKSTQMNVVQIFPEGGNMGKVLPDYLSAWTTDKVRKEGVTVMPNSTIKDAVVNSFGKLVLHLQDGKSLEVDHAIVAVGIEPNTELAQSSKLEVDESYKGFRVNAELEARSNLWCAGDAASFYDVVLGRRRVEHHDHAVVSGRLAGENMASEPKERKPYTHQSMFWSDLGPEVGYEAIGLVDSKLDTVGVFAKASDLDTPKAAVTKTNESIRSEAVEEGGNAAVSKKSANPEELKEGEKYGKGIVFYLKDNVVVGVLMWNVFGRMSVARKVIRENKRYEDLTELAKLFNIHSEELQEK